MNWCSRVRKLAPESRFCTPSDKDNPMVGWYTVVGPGGETGISHDSMEHAAMWFLAAVLDDKEAAQALGYQRETNA